MAVRNMTMTVYRGNRVQDTQPVTADRDNPAELQETLQNYLSAGRWDQGLWPDFRGRFTGAGPAVEVRAA